MRNGFHLRMVLLVFGAACVGVVPFVHGANGSGPQLAARASQGNRERQVIDATGSAVPVRPFRRIASCSSIADAVLPEFVPTERLVAVTEWYADGHPDAARLRHLPRISGPEDLEKIVALAPDLVIVSNYLTDTGPLERLRERGITVFDLGPMLGQRTLEKNLHDLGALMGQSERAAALARSFRRRMAQVAAHVPASHRKRGMYLNIYDTQLSGGTIGSSYHDVLLAAGLVDVAARGASEPFSSSRAFPRFGVEDVVGLDPEVIVTTMGKGRRICEVPGLELIQPCRDPRRIVELDERRLNDPGLGMLVAAEEICDRLYPSIR